MDPLWSQLWTFPTVVILLAFKLLFLSPRCNWAWVIDLPGGVGVKKPGSLWRVTRTAAGWAPALVLQDDEQVTVLDGGRREGWTGGGGSVSGGGLGSRRAACRSLGAFGRCPGDLASVAYDSPLTLKDEWASKTLIWASLAIWFCGVCRVGVGGQP